MSEEDLKVAEKYIQEDGGTVPSQCRGREGFDHHVEERRQTYEHTGKGLVPVVVTTLPARERRLFTRFTERREKAAIEREKAAIEKVSSLEEQWPKGNPSNLKALLHYLKHSSADVRYVAAEAIGEYLPVIIRNQSGRRTTIDGSAVEALLGALSSETNGPVLTQIGSSLGNTESLVTPDRLLDSLKGRSPADVARVAHGLDLLQPTEYRRQLRAALGATSS